MRNGLINLVFFVANIALAMILFEAAGGLGQQPGPREPGSPQRVLTGSTSPQPVAPSIFRRLPTEEPVVALTFDDGPSATTGQLLDILANHDVSATFFVLGVNALNNPGAVIRTAQHGHDIANHTWSHPRLGELPAEKVHWQVKACTMAVEAMGVAMQPMLRPPYGNRSEVADQVVLDLGYHVVLWDVDSRDWENECHQQVLNLLLANLRPGSIVLFHDGPAVTLAVLPDFIQAAKEQGYRFVLLSQYIPAPEPDGMGRPASPQ